ncbi:MAG: peptide ABC transporter substrate-binding protein [Acidobacteria bacterium]|nr:peptide ABC transporter substrate-binding protein [Acidobacteriota bacterium]
MKRTNLQKGLNFARAVIFLGLAVSFAFILAACGELEKPIAEEFYSETKPPRSKEFRWTNGQLPKTIDPAKVSAPPETDFVRALYEGLTETDPKTLEAVPGVAAEWSSSEDDRVWTFKLRRNAKWSNGKTVTAADFVESWQRLAGMGDEVRHHELLKNIVGMRAAVKKNEKEDPETKVSGDAEKKSETPAAKNVDDSNDRAPRPVGTPPKLKIPGVAGEKLPEANETARAEKAELIKEIRKKLGVEAIGEFELKVSLIQPDKEFPKLAAHPVFRPVYENGKEFEKTPVSTEIITNGAFSLDSVAEDGISLVRSENYWNKQTVKLERVRFVPTNDADSALLAYREGKVDAVTNAEFEPLALKLLTPFYDFRRVTHSALNFYEFNRQKAPFNDRRVREALAISIERDKLTADEMDGATTPAHKYLPFEEKSEQANLKYDPEKARDLLEKAGFANGRDFPAVRLVVNRNNVQQRIAKLVAKMWKDELNIETEIIVKEPNEMEDVKRDGDFDVLRSGVVLPTTDETANMLAIFKPGKLEKAGTEKKVSDDAAAPKKDPGILEAAKNPITEPVKERAEQRIPPPPPLPDPDKNSPKAGELVIDVGADVYILTEEDALIEVPGIPLYFPTSYSLVKPYVSGFEMNSLDAPSLRDVEIDVNWQPKSAGKES